MTSYADFYRRSIDDRDAFWGEQAKRIDWKKEPTQICDYSNPPFARWFVGGTTNLCYNAVDRHLATRADQPALVYMATELYTVAQKHLTLWGYMNDPLIFVVNKDIWNSWTPADREIVKQAANRHCTQRRDRGRQAAAERNCQPRCDRDAIEPRRARSLREGHAPRGREVERSDWCRPGEHGREGDCGAQEVTL